MHLNPHVRAYLDAVRDHLLGLHDKGVSARRVNEEHSDLIDRLVRKLFRLAEDRYFENFPRLNFRLSVIAVGGYGRRELSLGSDIDLLFLHKGKLNPYVETIAEAIAHRLWDARLAVGVATRTISDCLRVGAQDLSTLTSFLDARFLIGDPGLYADLEKEVRTRIKQRLPQFVDAKLEEQRARHERMGESLFLLQPNLRESVGGLRDYHTALWLAHAVQWDVRRPEHLHVHGFIDADELEALVAALDFVWRLRNELHRSGRKDDRLHYEAQMRLAEYLDVEGANERLRAERLMQTYYGHARAIARVSRRATSHVRGLMKRRSGRGARDAFSVEEGFAIADGKLEIPSEELLRERPLRLLAAFAVAQEHDVEISPRAERMLRQHSAVIGDAFRSDPEAAALFARILRADTRVYRTLVAMTELGILGAYLPEFGGLVGLWQQDMYHTYTVDVHSLFLVEQLRRLAKSRYHDELPLATELIREVRDPLVLFLGCLLHDIGKGRGGGHSQKGADLVPQVCERFGMEEEQMEAIRFLVRHHLTMSEMAERRDVHDPRQILKLANLAQTREQLRRLYLLTVADIRSVSPEAWTTWKGGLLEALFRNAAEWLEAGAEDEQASQFFLQRAIDGVARTEKQINELLEVEGADLEQVAKFLDSMPRRYLLSHAVSEIAEHVQAALRFLALPERVAVFSIAPPTEDQPFWGLLVFARDQPGLFSTVAGVLTALGHDILAAQAYTARGSLAVEIYQIAPIAGGSAEEEAERLRIETSLRQVIAGERSVEALVTQRRTPPPRPARQVPPAVRLSNDESDFYTVVDVTTNDRPALLYDVTRTLAELGLNVVISRASTRASRATDAFYVTDAGHKVTDPARREAIEAALLDAIRQGAG
jgi:[protein-PII] uridylyltransferase